MLLLLIWLTLFGIFLSIYYTLIVSYCKRISFKEVFFLGEKYVQYSKPGGYVKIFFSKSNNKLLNINKSCLNLLKTIFKYGRVVKYVRLKILSFLFINKLYILCLFLKFNDILIPSINLLKYYVFF